MTTLCSVVMSTCILHARKWVDSEIKKKKKVISTDIIANNHVIDRQYSSVYFIKTFRQCLSCNVVATLYSVFCCCKHVNLWTPRYIATTVCFSRLLKLDVLLRLRRFCNNLRRGNDDLF